MICPTDPRQIFFLNHEKIPGKGHPRARTLVEFKEKISRSFFYNMQITSEPLRSDPCARLKIQIPMHSISWGCPRTVRHCDPISLLLNTFGIYLEHGCKVMNKSFIITLLKMSKNKRQFCSIFRRFSYTVTREAFPVL